MRPGMFSRPSTITMPGMVLSQPEIVTRPSNMWLRATNSIGHHLAADQRALHPLGTHRDAVGDGDCVHLDGRAAGRPDPLHHLLGQLAMVPVARHRPDPGVCDADLGAREILVAEAHRFHHGAGGRPVRTFEENAASLARVEGHQEAPLSWSWTRSDSTAGRGAEPAGSPRRAAPR